MLHVLKEAKTQRQLITNTRKRHIFDHIMRRDKLKHVLTIGQIYGRKDEKERVGGHNFLIRALLMHFSLIVCVTF